MNTFGTIVAEDWAWLAERFASVDLDAFVVMPNHLHGIVVITGPVGNVQAGEGESSLAPTSARLSLGRIVGAFKTLSTKHVNDARGTLSASLWQRSFYEHIIRDDA